MYMHKPVHSWYGTIGMAVSTANRLGCITLQVDTFSEYSGTQAQA